MTHELEDAGIDYEMHYCARDAKCAAFSDEFELMLTSGRLHFHFDGGDLSAGLDLRGLLHAPGEGEHVYYCGPGGFMKACAEASGYWPSGTVHFEHFKAPKITPLTTRSTASPCALRARDRKLKYRKKKALRMRWRLPAYRSKRRAAQACAVPARFAISKAKSNTTTAFLAMTKRARSSQHACRVRQARCSYSISDDRFLLSKHDVAI